MARSLQSEARAVLEAAWDDERGYCYPNRAVYPHLWLWDSCFHSIAWSAVPDRRAGSELDSALAGQQPDGFLPHMRYAGPTTDRGPLVGVSSFTQPPVYAHAAVRALAAGCDLSDDTVHRVEAALDWLFRNRGDETGLLRIVHPWEAGTDDSPRFDDWVGSSEWNRAEWTRSDLDLVDAARFSPQGAAVGSERFEVSPAGFNSIAAHAAAETAILTGDPEWQRRANQLRAAIDQRLWNEESGLWSDLAVVGGRHSGHVPTLDGALGALVTHDRGKARRALAQLADPSRFSGRFGLRFVAADDPRYRPGQYWRGSSWMQLNYLAWLAAQRWGEDALAAEIAEAACRGAAASGFAEHWNPDSGEGHGAIPQTWTALALWLD